MKINSEKLCCILIRRLFIVLLRKTRKGEYSEGYMTIMKSWPDLRDAPDHPRKSVDDNTLHQHRLCIDSSEERIETYCHSVDKCFAINPAILIVVLHTVVSF